MTQTSFDKAKIRILLLEGVHASAVNSFREHGYSNITELSHALSGDELCDAISDVHVLGLRSRSQLNARCLAAARRLMAVGCYCIGTNQVELGCAAISGIPVFNAPFSNTRSVAELVLAEAILLLRGVPQKSLQMHQGIWQKSARASFEVRGKTLGVIGYGNIGAQLGVLAEALGMRVVFHDSVKKLNLGNAHQVANLAELLKLSDVVSLHVPATEQTRNMIGALELALMKPTAVFINASRGNVVDLDALGERLLAGQLLGAAIDVFPHEPGSNDDPFASPLIGKPNTLLTPHIGGSTLEAQVNIGIEVSEKLIRYSDNGSTLSAVNFPQVTLPEQDNKHRLLHIHHNVPGVLSAINQVVSEAGINISAQYLQTNSTIGYVVMDVDAEYSSTALDRLTEVPGTIRTRVLF
ncbi:MAG: phosphoglycerate dehydrogenase [Proteobacteria bacterium]|nr:phosphoglycerate dehydrogenase [Pseudomonadota bacterium]